MTKVLVIEDEAPLREEIVDTLSFEGYEVFSAGNGLAGLALAQEKVPDLVICDISMPELDGYGVLVELRQSPELSHMPFMFLTARADRSFMRHGMELGADDYLTKPFTRGEFLAAISARLKRQATISDNFARELEEAKTTLIRLVAHELRTPLFSIQTVRSIIDRQLGKLTPEALTEMVGEMSGGMDRLSHLVDQMVYLTNLEAGLLRHEEIMENGALISVESLLTRAIETGHKFAYRNINSTVQLNMHDPQVTIKAHTPALKHALAELISNALNFSELGSDVLVSQWQEDGYSWITIVDQGIGLSKAEREKLFQKFSQVNREKQEQQGIGMGLLVARGIVEAHGGLLDISAVPNKGTQVMIRLPLTQAEGD